MADNPTNKYLNFKDADGSTLKFWWSSEDGFLHIMQTEKKPYEQTEFRMTENQYKSILKFIQEKPLHPEFIEYIQNARLEFIKAVNALGMDLEFTDFRVKMDDFFTAYDQLSERLFGVPAVRVFGRKDDANFWSDKPIQLGHPVYKESKVGNGGYNTQHHAHSLRELSERGCC